MEIDFYYVKDEYISYLKEAEKHTRGFTCVPNTQYRSRNKFLFGACFQQNGINYFVPVSHQIKRGDNNIIIKTKPKKGKSIELGSLRFAYMLPVPNKCLVLLDIKNIREYDQKRRINDELAFCRRSIDKIKRQAQKTFDAIISSKNDKLLRNSCDFLVLQSAYISYCQENGIELPKVLQEQINLRNNQSNASKTNTTSGSQTIELNKSLMMKLSNLTKDEFEILIQSKIDCKFIKNEKGITAIFKKEDAEKVRAALTQDQEVKKNHKPPKR